MNEHEQELLCQMQNSGESRGKGNFLRRTKCEFVIEHGWWYTPMRSPPGLPKGTNNECFKNAALLLTDHKKLTYVEGYAIRRNGLKIAHAWVTDGQGNAIDTTWSDPGMAYAGVPFSSEFVVINFLQNQAITCLIDDFRHDWPLLRELGDRPGEWLSVKGRGRTKIVVPLMKPMS